MGSILRKNEKIHIVFIPLPAQGHINAMLRLAKLLYCHISCHVTFLHTKSNYQRVLDSSSGGPNSVPDDFRFETIEAELALDRRPLYGPLQGPTRDVLTRISKEVPAVTCVVYDVFMSYVAELAKDMGVQSAALCPVSACSFMGFLWTKELVDRDIVPLKNESDLTNGYLDTLIDIIPGLGSIRLRDLPSTIRTTDPEDNLLNLCIDEMQCALHATSIIVHTFEDLERPVLDALSQVLPPIYSVGPLPLLAAQIGGDKVNSIGSSLWKEDSECLTWLDGRERGSVIYVNLGSAITLTEHQVNEFAIGIANSGHDFLWVIRPDIVMSVSVSDVLPVDFLAETRERGLVTSWCMQEDVLKHPAIGGFLTHCGWNSTMEAISAGVPVICWPVFADQPTNCRYLCNEWGVGLEINENVTSCDVEEKIRQLLSGEKGEIARENANKWKESAKEATEKGGKSWINLEKLIKDAVLA